MRCLCPNTSQPRAHMGSYRCHIMSSPSKEALVSVCLAPVVPPRSMGVGEARQTPGRTPWARLRELASEHWSGCSVPLAGLEQGGGKPFSESTGHWVRMQFGGAPQCMVDLWVLEKVPSPLERLGLFTGHWAPSQCFPPLALSDGEEFWVSLASRCPRQVPRKAHSLG